MHTCEHMDQPVRVCVFEHASAHVCRRNCTSKRKRAGATAGSMQDPIPPFLPKGLEAAFRSRRTRLRWEVHTPEVAGARALDSKCKCGRKQVDAQDCVPTSFFPMAMKPHRQCLSAQCISCVHCPHCIFDGAKG